MSKTIEINKKNIINLILSFLIGFATLYGLEHFGEFSFSSTYSHINQPTDVEGITQTYSNYSDKVNEIVFTTFFKNEIKTDGNGFTIYDFSFKDTDFNNYSVKSYYYTQSTIKDIKYGIYISLILFIIITLISNFKIKFT